MKTTLPTRPLRPVEADLPPESGARQAAQDPYELVHFALNQDCLSRWDVTVYLTKDSVPVNILESFALKGDITFFVDHLWCDTGPGQNFLWNDYPADFLKVLRKYEKSRCPETAGPQTKAVETDRGGRAPAIMAADGPRAADRV
jgi:hypothetical protein